MFQADVKHCYHLHASLLEVAETVCLYILTQVEGIFASGEHKDCGNALIVFVGIT